MIPTMPDEVEALMTGPLNEALKLQRPASDGSLRIIARGIKPGQAAKVTEAASRGSLILREARL